MSPILGKRNDDRTEDEDKRSFGLLYGISAWHVRLLCDNAFDGGRQYTPRDVGELTLDQVFMLLTDRKMLLKRTSNLSALQAGSSLADKEGMIAGRAADGTPIKGRISGVSKARQMAEAAAKSKKTKTKRGRHGN